MVRNSFERVGLHIAFLQEMASSSTGRDTGCRNCGFRDFAQYFQEIVGVASFRSGLHLSNLLYINNPTIRLYVSYSRYWKHGKITHRKERRKGIVIHETDIRLKWDLLKSASSVWNIYRHDEYFSKPRKRQFLSDYPCCSRFISTPNEHLPKLGTKRRRERV